MSTPGDYSDQASERERILATLDPVKDRNPDIRPCSQGTRQKVLNDIFDWANDDSVPNILHLAGVGGSGKTTIASSLVSRWKEEDKLGASFFIRWDARSDPATLWPSVAFDLAQFDPVASDIVVRALKEKTYNPQLADIQRCFEQLIVPIATARRFVVIIDALDECGWADSQAEQRSTFFQTLSMWPSLPASSKLVITSRYWYDIPHMFLDTSIVVRIELHADTEVPDSDDMRVYFSSHLDGLDGLVLEPNIIDEMSRRAEGIFLWANTVVKFLKGERPIERLDLILNGIPHEGASVLNDLYIRILRDSFEHASNGNVEGIRSILAALGSVDNLYTYDLPYLTSQDPSVVTSILNQLSSLIDIGPDNGVRAAHPSFSAFLLNVAKLELPSQFTLDMYKYRVMFEQARAKRILLGRAPAQRLEDDTASSRVHAGNVGSLPLNDYLKRGDGNDAVFAGGGDFPAKARHKMPSRAGFTGVTPRTVDITVRGAEEASGAPNHTNVYVELEGDESGTADGRSCCGCCVQ